MGSVEARGPLRARARGEALVAFGAALVTVVLWASAFVGIRAAGSDVGAGALALGRLLIGSLVLGALVLARREAFPRARDLPLILLCGLLWFTAYNVLLNASEHHLDAGTAAMLVNVGPILIALLAGVLLGEGFPRLLFVGMAIAFAGVAVIALATAESGLSILGTVLALLAAVGYAGGLIAQKFVLERVSALQTTWLCCVVGATACLPFAPSLVDDVRGASTGSLVWLVYLGVFPTAIAFTTWAFALARTQAGRLAPLTYLVPPISIALGWVFLQEAPPALAFLGGAFCLLGVWFARRG
jgi:drug/metabolite transporter (DMT)-like permease